MTKPPRLSLANRPTPLQRWASLDRHVGAEVWVKRDDMTGGAETGNKVRKLEYLLADAQRAGAEVVVTCGGLQSNHCRATALAARRLGMQPVLLLRHAGPLPEVAQGNLLLDRMLAADIRIITPAEYAERDRLMAQVAAEFVGAGRRAYVIPEGGSNGLGSLAYVDVAAEMEQQLAEQEQAPFDAVAVACGSGGTAAGLALGLGFHPVAPELLAFAVCDDEAYFRQRIMAIVADARTQAAPSGGHTSPTQPTHLAKLTVIDRFKGPGYGVPSGPQRDFIRAVARDTGLILDPVYTGKALFGLSRLETKPRRVCFVHTGGLPGLFPQAAAFGSR